MRRITLLMILVVGLFTIDSAYSQATKQLNFGLIGISYDIPVAADIAVAPFVAVDWNLDYLTIGAKGNYYFDMLMELPEPWDVYAGANVGYGVWIGSGDTSSKVALGLQVGGRWFWSEKWGAYAELGGGVLGANGVLGVTMKL